MFYWAVSVVLFVAYLKFRKRRPRAPPDEPITEDLLVTEPMTPPKQPPSPSSVSLPESPPSPYTVPLPPSPMEIVSPHQTGRYYFSQVRRRHFTPH